MRKSPPNQPGQPAQRPAARKRRGSPGVGSSPDRSLLVQHPGDLLLTFLLWPFLFPPMLAAQPSRKPVERKYTLGFGIAGQNILNRVHFASPVGVLGSPLFGQASALAGMFGSGPANRTINAQRSVNV